MDARKARVFAQVTTQARIEEPARSILGILAQQVDFVVAQNGHRLAGAHQLAHQADHARAVRSAIDEIPHKYQGAALGVVAARVIPQMPQQLQQGLQLAVDVTNDIQRPGGQRLYQTHGKQDRTTRRACPGGRPRKG